jgi:hypothetical protein
MNRKVPGRVARDLVANLPRVATGAVARAVPVARPPHGTDDAPWSRDRRTSTVRVASTLPGDPGSIAAGMPALPSSRVRALDAAIYLLPHPPVDQGPSARLRTEEGQDRVAEPLRGNGGGRPPFSSVTSPLRTASPTPVRSALRTFGPNERSPPACVGRRSMAGDIRAMSPVGPRSGSRPKIMVARFVTPERDPLCRPFASSEVRSDVRDRRLEWPPVRRVPTCSEPYGAPCGSGMGG